MDLPRIERGFLRLQRNTKPTQLQILTKRDRTPAGLRKPAPHRLTDASRISLRKQRS